LGVEVRGSRAWRVRKERTPRKFHTELTENRGKRPQRDRNIVSEAVGRPKAGDPPPDKRLCPL
jgi:hypothetical protein